MARRTLRVTVDPDWKGRLRAAGRRAQRGRPGCDTLNFESPEAFFAHLTPRRWTLLQALLGAGELPVRELARRVGRDVRRVHDDVRALAALGLVERTDSGGVRCPYRELHVDVRLRAHAAAA
ncbi:MAG TPA: MarR family transcriptional regulator [Chromatiales bacterium]|nr:MarR family transcriptional regulator [Chromatiales bacterium]